MTINVSVIIPVYNVQKYLSRCLQSVEQQTYQNLEIILVDDGSTDKSGIICDEYKNKHENTIVIHQENQGLSGARNIGVSVSRGKYITFVDSDDIISKDYVYELVNSIEKYKADLAVGRSIKFWDIIPIKYGSTEIEVLNAEKTIIEMCNGYNFGVSACCKLYKRELVVKYPYPIGKLYEDLATTYKIIGDCEKVVFIKRYLYYYRQRPYSISNNRKMNDAQLYGLEAAQGQLSYVRERYPNAIPAAQARCILKAFDYMPFIADGSKESMSYFKKIRKYAIENGNKIVLSRKVNLQNKIRYISLRLGYKPSLFATRVLNAVKNRRALSKG